MIKFKNKIILSSALISGLWLFSCSYDLDPSGAEFNIPADEITILKAQVDIAGGESEAPQTRLTIEPDDHWSYAHSSFVLGDTVGVFARQGNMNLMTSDGKGGPLINVPMYFVNQEYPTDPNNPNSPTTTSYTLENDTVLIRPSVMNNVGVMMYYPYSSKMGSLANYPGWKDYATTVNTTTARMVWDDEYPAIPGIELRTLAPDGSIRLRDVLHMYQANNDYLKKGLLRGTFYHLFVELVIMRGEGFDNPVQKVENPDGTFSFVPNDEVVVVLNKPLSHIRAVSEVSTNTRWAFQLFYENGYVFNGKAMGEEEASRWTAWKGENFPYDDKGTNPGQPAWYVMLPTVYYTNTSTAAINNQQYTIRPTVTEILIYDNYGYLQHVSSIELKADDTTATSTHQPYPSRKYAIEISMKELKPTVRPVNIENWDMEGKDKDITEVRNAGILSEYDYEQWAIAYNDYINNGRSQQFAEPLLKYGDMIDGGAIWNFYIAPFNFTRAVPVVNDLQDQLIGNNNFFNIAFDNLKLTHPLFNKISRNGGIANINFNNPYLSCNYPTPVGLLAGSIESNGSPGVVFSNCNISNGTVINQGEGAVGLLSGTCSYGVIEGCSFTGFLMGDSSDATFNGLFGVAPENNPELPNSKYNGITY